MSSITIYTPDPTDPFVIGLREMSMPELPEDSIFRWGGRESGWNHTEETKELLREKSMGNSSALGKNWSNPNSHKKAATERMLTDANPMSNPDSREKISSKMKVKKKCPHCDMMGNAGNMARHIKARHS